MYRPVAQEYRSDAALIVRVDGSPLAFAPQLRAVIGSLDPDLPIVDLRTLTEATSLSLLPIRVAATVVAAWLRRCWVWPRSGSTVCCRSWSDSEPARSASTWHSAPTARGSARMVLLEALRWIGMGCRRGPRLWRGSSRRLRRACCTVSRRAIPRRWQPSLACS